MFQQEIDRENGYRPGVGIILMHDGNALLCHRESWISAMRYSDEQGFYLDTTPKAGWTYGWDIPQGGIESGETFSQAIHREVSEELGKDWADALDQPRMLRRECLDFPVYKDGRQWRGKTYYYHTVEVSLSESYFDWVWGPNWDEIIPTPYPTGQFPGGVLFMNHREARERVMRTQPGRKGQLVLSVLDELRQQRMIRSGN